MTKNTKFQWPRLLGERTNGSKMSQSNRGPNVMQHEGGTFNSKGSNFVVTPTILYPNSRSAHTIILT